MRNRFSGPGREPVCWPLGFLALLALLLAACGQHGRRGAGLVARGSGGGSGGYWAPTRFYPPPGPPSDPWGPYVREAAARHRIPEQWVRAVMRQESGGQQQAVSSAGAMGLMQVMPATYSELRARYGLGDDPFHPRDNILAGAAYLREMFDRYGAPGFLAAYNAGPDRVDSFLAGNADLPDETVSYLAALTPRLGPGASLSGPLAAYAARPRGKPAPAPSAASLAAGCDVNAAFDPDHPCTALMQAAVMPARQAPAPQAAEPGCDTDAAFDPDHPCTTLMQAAVSVRQAPVPQAAALGCDPDAAFDPDRPCHAGPAAVAWAIQVGAFASPDLARAVADNARRELPGLLRSALVTLPPTTRPDGSVLYRARLLQLSAGAASEACAQLNGRQLPCVVVPPTGS